MTPARGALLLICALVPLLAAPECALPGTVEPKPSGAGDPPAAALRLTVNGIPDGQNEALVVPPSGFLVDVAFADPAAVFRDTLSLQAFAWTGNRWIRFESPLFEDENGSVYRVSRSDALAPGSLTLAATVELVDGGSESVLFSVAVREPKQPPPLAVPQWIQLNFDADRDADGRRDLPDDLAVFGLASGGESAAERVAEAWVIDEIIARAQELYDAPNPSRLPDGDPLAVTFSEVPPEAGPYSEICVGGLSPGGVGVIGNVRLDPGNRNPSDVACDDRLPSGVFPRQLTDYEDEPSYRSAFAALVAAPIGSDPRDDRVLGPDYDPADPDQAARLRQIEHGVQAFAQAIASIAAHEAGHAMGLVPPGRPGRGLFGGAQGPEFTHALTPEGLVSDENLLMSPGPSFRFDELIGAEGSELPRLRELDVAYLQGRILQDDAVDGIYLPPSAQGVSPSAIDPSGAPLQMIEVSAFDLRDTPSLRLRGPVEVQLGQVTLTHGSGGEPDRLSSWMLAPALLPGTYDVEIENPDGQTSTLESALEVR